MVTILSALIQAMEIIQCGTLFSAAPFLMKSGTIIAKSHNRVEAKYVPGEKQQHKEQHLQLNEVIYLTKNY